MPDGKTIFLENFPAMQKTPKLFAVQEASKRLLTLDLNVYWLCLLIYWKSCFLRRFPIGHFSTGSNSPIDSPRTIQCLKLAELLTSDWALYFQWVFLVMREFL
ncbi:hypothetical protein CEXT_709891, partial [Caerostris extrusa]